MAFLQIPKRKDEIMNLANMKKSETTEQILLFTWASRNEDFFPALKNMFHVPNEGKRTNGPVLKAAGLKDGVPDVLLLVPRNGFCGLAIEMKFGKNKTTASQEDWLERLKKAGYKTAVCTAFWKPRQKSGNIYGNPENHQCNFVRKPRRCLINAWGAIRRIIKTSFAAVARRKENRA